MVLPLAGFQGKQPGVRCRSPEFEPALFVDKNRVQFAVAFIEHHRLYSVGLENLPIDDKCLLARAGRQQKNHPSEDYRQSIHHRSEEHTSELQSLMRISY